MIPAKALSTRLDIIISVFEIKQKKMWNDPTACAISSWRKTAVSSFLSLLSCRRNGPISSSWEPYLRTWGRIWKWAGGRWGAAAATMTSRPYPTCPSQCLQWSLTKCVDCLVFVALIVEKKHDFEIILVNSHTGEARADLSSWVHTNQSRAGGQRRELWARTWWAWELLSEFRLLSTRNRLNENLPNEGTEKLPLHEPRLRFQILITEMFPWRLSVTNSRVF